jgi:membrane-bound serine protease (ClpP class)
MFWMLGWLAVSVGMVTGASGAESAAGSKTGPVYVLPIREDIMPPLTYLVRRGVKEAMEADASLLIIDMDTNGGRVDVTEDIIDIISRFKGPTVTLVNRKAFSAGAFISFATGRIFMTPQSVIGAAAPIMMAPGGAGVEQMPDTLEAKTVSAISALVRANAEKNGHNVEVAEAMVKKTKELKVDGKVLNEKGQILTLTNREAEQEYGTPPKALLSAGTVDTLEALIEKLAPAGAQRVDVVPLGAERLGSWITMISPLLMIIGMAGLYIEFKTPGFGVPGIVGLTAFAIYFFGGYVAGLAGLEWALVFVLGLVLIGLELFVFPGTIVPGLIGAAAVLVSLIMAMVDIYPGGPILPPLPALRFPIMQLCIGMTGSALLITVLARLLPKTSAYNALVSQGVSGERTIAARGKALESRVGQVGVAISPLRPGGKAQFGDAILDVRTQGEMIPKGTPVRIMSTGTGEPVVEPAS